jgi:methylase of polypeptide subunit release factors
MREVIDYYDYLIDEGNDPVYDSAPLREYMDKWDGQSFIDKMQLDNTKSVFEIGVGTGRLAVRIAHLCISFTGIDFSPKTIKKARINIPLSNVNLICDDFLSYKFESKFDVIYSPVCAFI